MTIPHQALSYNIIGAAMEVHQYLGPGLLEVLYSRALAHEFKLRDLTFEREVSCRVRYKEQSLGEYRLDFVVAKANVVEVKALPQLTKMHYAQAYNYLAGTHLEICLLLNFGALSLEYKRLLGPCFNSASTVGIDSASKINPC